MPFDTKGALHAFKQQQLKAWQPILTPKPVIATFAAIGLAFVGIGVLLLLSSQSVTELTVDYGSVCGENATCRVPFEIDSSQASGFDGQTVFVYYKLEKFYQNHRRYVKSRNDEQLRGSAEITLEDTEDCGPIRKFEDLGDLGATNSTAAPDEVLNPCGLIAWSQFNDTFALRQNNANRTLVRWRKSGIAWQEDLDLKFSNPPADAKGVRVVPNYLDEDFVVWMRTAGLPTFRKLYRKILTPLPKGQYFLDIENNFPVSGFDGKKSLVFSTTAWVGGRNDFLGIAYLVVGGLCLIQALLFLAKHLHNPRKLGDVSRLGLDTQDK